MAKWAVIGASSFTGTHFTDYLREHGHEVCTYSLRSPGALTHLRVWKPEYVINFAAMNVVAPSWTYPDKYFDVNLTQFSRLVLMLRELDSMTRYVHVSTPEVYGGESVGQNFETDLFFPSTPYASSRAAQEELCHMYDLPVVFTRASNVYGPGQQLYRLIPKVIMSILKGQKFPLEGGGTSRRDFIHVRDVCAATLTVAEKGSVGHAYNIATRFAPRPIREVVDDVCDMLGRPFAECVTETPARPGQDSVYHLNTDRIRMLGWTEQVAWLTGLHGVVEWATENFASLKDQPMEYRP